MGEGGFQPVPNSSASAAPRSAAWADACDAHLHIYDPRFPAIAPTVANATVADYRRVQALLGTRRAVIVQPRCYGTDHSATLDAIRQLGIASTRGVAVVRPDVSDETLQALHAGGIQGIRFSLYTPAHAVVGFEMVETLAHRVAELDWHLQLHWTADQIVAHGDLLGAGCPRHWCSTIWPACRCPAARRTRRSRWWPGCWRRARRG